MGLPEDVYEDELIDAFDAPDPEPEAPAPTKAPATSPQRNSANLGQPTRPKVQEFHAKTTLYPAFDDAEASVAPAMPSPAVTSRKEVQQQDVPVGREQEFMSDQELQRSQQQIEREVRVYQERFDRVAQALAGETPHQIQERKKREEERLERQEKRHEAVETRVQHQIERLEEREERRARIQARHHRASRSPSPDGQREPVEDAGKEEQDQ
ncbi:hypothetical protein PHYPSEUDO_005469 [Phytophthora pseudosyringae]|uniref:Uncharacterized protein n=1 Tax=Phytophthora pseudosyringae TaxID=221518 RepID=A0A8T1VL11_9STRA|nr:hypothetical protein PHYPSEUDO_005469 [Phytophthora pseudosyringae]